MYSVLHKIFSDKSDGTVFTCFGAWHFGYIALVLLITFFVFRFLKNKSIDQKNRVARVFINISFGIFIADFFFMPIAYGEIDIEKLPFHICTAMCVASFLSYRWSFLEKFRASFALLGFISNLVYLIYPAGVMWHQTHPLSYRVIETLMFHGFMCIYGLLVLVFEKDKLCFKKCYRDFFVIVGMTLWAMLGNSVYNGDYGGKTRFFNWFFVVRDPFNIFSEESAPFIMPILNIILFFAAELLIYLILNLTVKHKK